MALVTLLALAMVTATYLTGALSVLSGYLIKELDLTRSQVGFAFAAFSLTGGAASPAIGALADRELRGVMLGLFAAGLTGVVLAALSGQYWVLLLATMLGGLALGAGNPATNRIISHQISKARRGLVVGLKQSGPPMALLAAGLILPPLAETFGWRAALTITALIPAVGIAATKALVPPGLDAQPIERPPDHQNRTTRAVIWLTFLGFGVAVAMSAVIAFIPLYAQEAVGLSPGTAGLVASAMGLSGVVGRIGWGAFGDKFQRPSSALLIVSGLSIVAAWSISAAASSGSASLLIGALIAGISMFAWHSIAWLMIINMSGNSGVGRASGVMQVGTSVGFATGPAMAGVVIDLSGDYGLAWSLVTLLFALITVSTFLVRRSFAAT